MKRKLLLFLAGAVVMELPACVKHLDVGELIQQEVKSCPIVQLESLDTLNPVQIVVHYNTAGNPVEVLNVEGTNPADMQDYHFRYDRFNRLTDYLMNPSISPAALGWHTYTYPSKSMVVDSIYGENDPALITAPKPNADGFLGVTFHFLDSEGRIIEDQGFNNATFQYDAWGNLIRGQPFPYDNKSNPYLTNNVWRFIFEDYSVNNYLGGLFGPFTITKYNAFGLPENFQGYGQELFNYSFFTLQITYGCNGGKKS
ncbi:MAG TPA: hypothetical protein VMH27_05670 [Puia sp.]|nr:hypothetical protein [Puia sp.]